MQTTLLRATAFDIVAFFLGLGLAYSLHWETRDLIWSLWLSSLVIGSVTILATIAAGAYIAWHVIHHPDFPARYRTASLAAGTVITLFFIGFFALHFGAFHAGHAAFLSDFFPLENLPDNVFMNAFMNPLLLGKIAVTYLFPLYGLFLLPMLISERKAVFGMLNQAIHFVKTGIHNDDWIEKIQEKALKQKDKKDLGKVFYQPYVNVIRMHLLIIFFAFAYSFGFQGFWLYALVYAVYFFPWKTIEERWTTSHRNIPR